MKKLNYLFLFVFITAFGISCSSTDKLNNPTTQATLWVQNAAEYEAITRQVYASALRNLPLAKEDSYWTADKEQQQSDFSNLPPAVILDVDETILDNSPFQARMIKQGKTYNTEDWNNWVRDQKAEAVPGALEFTQYAADQGIEVFYITNREHKVEDATRKNLIELGFPVSGSMDNLLTKGERDNWTSAKTERRRFIARNYRIIMLFGDDLNDFLPAKDISQEDRSELVDENTQYFGRKWFILPNPVYGSWEQALFEFESDLSDEQRKQMKNKRLDTKNN